MFKGTNKNCKRKMKNKKQIDDSNLQFIVLLNLIIEKIEFLEENGYIYGSIKSFLVNGKRKFEDFISKVFNNQDQIDGETALNAANKLLVMQQRVEKALENEYIITVDERKDRARDILSKYLVKPIVENVIKEMEEKNLFNF